MCLDDAVDNAVGLLDGFGPVNRHPVFGQFRFQLLQQVRQPGQGARLDAVTQLPKILSLLFIRKGVGPLLHQRIHGGAEVGAQLVIRQGSGGPAAEVGGQFGDGNSLAHTAPCAPEH